MWLFGFKKRLDHIPISAILRRWTSEYCGHRWGVVEYCMMGASSYKIPQFIDRDSVFMSKCLREMCRL
jgi:hypothetical protein